MKSDENDQRPNPSREEIRLVATHVRAGLLKNARKLRRTQTRAETILWHLIRNRKLNGWKFRRQHPIIDHYILDFFCAETKVAIELDGLYHNDPRQAEYDKYRTMVLNEFGVRVIRFSNDEVMENAESVLEQIAKFNFK